MSAKLGPDVARIIAVASGKSRDKLIIFVYGYFNSTVSGSFERYLLFAEGNSTRFVALKRVGVTLNWPTTCGPIGAVSIEKVNEMPIKPIKKPRSIVSVLEIASNP